MRSIITSTKEVLFSSVVVCEQDISKADGFGWKFVERWDLDQGKVDSILRQISR